MAVPSGSLLPAGTRREDIPARLEAYQRLRMERGEFVNTESVAQLSKGFNLVEAKEIQSYLLSYDVMKAAEVEAKKFNPTSLATT
ncbi:hypothetical protein B0H14DRAFT_435291 [Mycena olivaceomarginata]|nr:hypothetical protein B0H14DRAFT_435291 [Mycena olivaceomarginata]